MQMAWFSILTLRKIMTEIANPHQMPTTSGSPKIMANCLCAPPQALHIFHIHLHTTPHNVCQNHCNTAPPMLPCGECTALLSNHAIIYLTTKPMCHIIWKPPMHGHSRIFQHHPIAHIFGPGIHHVKFIVALQPQFPIFYHSLLAPLRCLTVCESST